MSFNDSLCKKNNNNWHKHDTPANTIIKNLKFISEVIKMEI